MIEEQVDSADVLGVADKMLNHNKRIDSLKVSQNSDTIFR